MTAVNRRGGAGRGRRRRARRTRGLPGGRTPWRSARAARATPVVGRCGRLRCSCRTRSRSDSSDARGGTTWLISTVRARPRCDGGRPATRGNPYDLRRTPGQPPGVIRPALVRQDDRLDPVAQLELGEDPADVGLHRRLRDVHPGGDLGVGEPLRHQQQHLPLPLGELGQPGIGGRRGAELPGEPVEQPPGDRRARPPSRPGATTRIAASSSSGGTFLSRNPLAPARSAANASASVSNVVSTSTRGRPVVAPAQIRRVASTPSMVGMRRSITTTSDGDPVEQPQRVRAVAGLADHRQVGLGVEHHPEPGAYQRLVVDDHHPYRHAAALPSPVPAAGDSGSRARTRQPPASVGPAARLPSYTPTRSRMPTRP